MSRTTEATPRLRAGANSNMTANVTTSARAPARARRFDPARGPVLVLGHSGMLGQALMHVAAERGHRVLGVSGRSVPGLSLARQSDLSPWLDPLAPSLVINAAAITDLAANEADPAAATELHARLPGLLADWARRRSTPWVQVSTDHYWNDTENRLHDEAAEVKPPNVYGRSKLAGEQKALLDPACLVLRTNIVGFRGRVAAPTFVEWALSTLARDKPFHAYTDVWASSIEVHQFAHAMFDLVSAGATGLVNLAARESTSKADFIIALARASGHESRRLRQVARATLPTRISTPRANAMGLDVRHAEALLGRKLPSAAEVIEAIVSSPGMPKPTLRMDAGPETGRTPIAAGQEVHEARAQGEPDVLLA